MCPIQQARVCVCVCVCVCARVRVRARARVRVCVCVTGPVHPASLWVYGDYFPFKSFHTTGS